MTIVTQQIQGGHFEGFTAIVRKVRERQSVAEKDMQRVLYVYFLEGNVYSVWPSVAR